jgi:hypothetical protein
MDPMDEYIAEIARRFAASYISAHLHSSFNTEYRKLKGQAPGQLWFSLARLAVEGVASNGVETTDFVRMSPKGPVQ